MKYMPSVARRFAVPALLLAFSLPSHAVEIGYEGFTQGTFSDAATADVLSFSGAHFGPGLLVDGTTELSNLGTFTVTLPSQNPGIVATGTFSLQVTFTLPAGANASPVVATVSGTINKNNANNVLFDFGPAQTVSFGSAEGHGSFLFTVNDVIFPNTRQTGDWQRLTGAISQLAYTPASADEVPEPGTLALLGLGLAGLGLSRRRKAD